MSSSSDFADQPDQPSNGRSAEPFLPPVEPPNAGFLLQLFLIPLMIVAIIVVVWLLFSWLAHLGSDPHSLVTDLKRMNQASWQKAMTLADLLRNPEHESLKDDPKLAEDLAEVLSAQIDTGDLDKNSVKMRMFLCRALGEFRSPEVLPVLEKAVVTDRDGDRVDGIEINVRLSALEAIALVAKNIGPEVVRERPELMKALFSAAVERNEDQDALKREQSRQDKEPQDRLDLRTPRSEVRAVAAFTLGVIGGPEALDKLFEVTRTDPYANSRYNAATGLARYGDARAIPTLVEMLDPENARAFESEVDLTEQAWKRVLVLNNGIRAARALIEKNSQDDLTPLIAALEKLVASHPQRGVLLEAQEALKVIQTHQRPQE